MLPADTLKDRVAIITGGGTGMGAAMAHRFSDLGAKVVVASRKMENLERVAGEIARKGSEALAVQVDVRQVEQVNSMVEQAVERFGGVDILVNNAAGNFVARAIDLTPNGWNAVVGIVLNGAWFCSQAVAKRMVEQGRGGAMLNIIATYAWTGAPARRPRARPRPGCST
jgi:NAD(P)-dependent dehydrogenase (short-subunit alcohol dehydrogenase family)